MQVTYTPHLGSTYKHSIQKKHSGVNKIKKSNEEPERYYDWMLWKLRQKDSEDLGNKND